MAIKDILPNDPRKGPPTPKAWGQTWNILPNDPRKGPPTPKAWGQTWDTGDAKDGAILGGAFGMIAGAIGGAGLAVGTIFAALPLAPFAMVASFGGGAILGAGVGSAIPAIKDHIESKH